MEVIEPQPINFQKIIAEIEAAGITAYKICLMMHRDKTQLKRWKKGAEPRHYEGVMLLMIHAEFVKKPDDQVRGEQGDTDGEGGAPRYAISPDERVARVG